MSLGWPRLRVIRVNWANNLAALYQAQGKYTEAEPLFKRALWIDEKALGLGHPYLASDLNSLAERYRAQGKYVEHREERVSGSWR